MGKSQKVKALSVNTILFALSSFGTKFITFFLVPLYTYVLSTEEYGNLDLMTTTAQLLVPFLTLNIQDAVLRFALEKKYKPDEVINIGVKVFGVGSFILLPGVLIVSHLPFISLESYYFWYLYALFITNALHNIFSMYLKAISKVKLLVISGIVNTLTTCTLNILLMLVWKLGVMGYMAANVSGLLLSIMLMVLFGGIVGTIGTKTSGRLLKEMAMYSLPLVVNSMAWWINNASDRYILTFFCGAAVNGIYAIAYKIPAILSSIQSVFYNSWSISAITEFDHNDSDSFISNVYDTYSCISFIGCSAIIIANVFIARLLYANEFYQAWRFVPLLLLGTVFNGMSLFEGCLFAAAKKTKTISVTTFAGAIFNTALNFLLIPFMGAFGAAIATCASYFVVWAVRTYQLLRFMNLKIGWKSQICTIAFILCQCIVAVATEKFYVQIVFAGATIFCQRKNIKKMFVVVKNYAMIKLKKF